MLRASVAGRHIPSSMCFRTLHPYLVIMPTCDLENFLNAIHNPEYQNPVATSFKGNVAVYKVLNIEKRHNYAS